MRSFSREILITFAVKIVLLTALWFFCFHHIEKPQSFKQYLFGSPVTMEAIAEH
ncbi:cytochrome oxidase putative small subunit CydP [Legionella quinlivanii]|uniref:cytochrome oxidase putative small subunit CydP n=1 Tax=Legionella quinlivanii TaxID=45073 RepID=UPI0015586504|nr:cytochrome oxidase putative small subunit CydP [Legionella quinlivanii]